jgi:CubicO group peptidase (beta-lactamase class C family)
MAAIPGDSLPLAAPAEVGMSAERLARIGPRIERDIEERRIPGAVTLVARHGKIVHLEARGYRNAEKQIPMTVDTVFRIASMTKPITSVALMQLYEQGAFQLGDPIARWLPAFEKMVVAVDRPEGGFELVPARAPIEVGHVLTHTAGFASEHNPKNTQLLRAAARVRSGDVIGDFVDRLAALPLSREPGRAWDYSRATCVVGRLVEVISGQTLADYFREQICEPLGMVDTHFFLPEHKLSRFGVAYTPGPDRCIQPADPDTLESYWLSKTSRYYMGSGGLVSTASDYFRFADLLMQGGRRGAVRLLSRKTVELMTRNHVGDLPVWLTGPGHGFGLGFGVVRDRGRTHAMASEGSYSWGGAYCTYWWNDPVERLTALVMTQLRPYQHLSLRADFQTLATQAIDD